MTLQYDLFSQPEPLPSPSPAPEPQTEIRACGTCGGRGSYNVFLASASGVRDRYPSLVTCPDCKGEKKVTAAVKPDCPKSVVEKYGHEPGTLVAMIKFVEAMKTEGYGLKATTGGALDTKKAKQCCNVLLREVASDRPEPKKEDWEKAARFVQEDPFMDEDDFKAIEDDPDPTAQERRIASINAAEEAEKTARKERRAGK